MTQTVATNTITEDDAETAIPIILRATEADRREFYGLLFESVTTHEITSGDGQRVHNAGSQHKIQVWMSKRSRRTDDLARTSEPVYRDCDGQISTRGHLHFRTSAQACMIASTPVDRPPRGEWLKPGMIVELSGFGYFRVTSAPLSDPILTPVEVV